MSGFTAGQVAQLLRPISGNRVLRDGKAFDRIAGHVQVDQSGCWLWTGALKASGYGRVRVDKREWAAHRLMYVLYVGEVASGLDLDHLCRVRRCVNPEHLEPVTRAVNLQRGHWPNSAKTHCPSNHPYDAINTFINSRGSRECRICRRVGSLRRYYQRKGVAK